MADKNIKLIVEAILKDKAFKKGVAGMSSSAKKATGVFKSMKSILASLGVAFSAAQLVRAFKSALKVSMEFEQSIANVASVSGGSRKELEKLARTAGKNTVFSARQSADALYFLASAGLDVKDMAKVLTPTLNFAAAAQIEIAEATDLVVNQLKTYQASMSDAEKFTDIMAKTVSSSNTNMRQLGDALGYASSIASRIGIPFEKLNAVVGALADRGIKGARAGVQLRQAFARLIDPTSEAQKVLDKYGITQEEINESLNDPIKLFKLLEPAVQNAQDATRIFGVRQQDVIGIIKNGIPRIEELTKATSNAGGAAKKMADIQLDTLQSRLKLLKSAWEDQVIAIGQKVEPALSAFVTSVTELLRGEGDLKQVTDDLIKVSKEYAEITNTLATESDRLDRLERQKLETRKAELKLDITKRINLVNKAYREQQKVLKQSPKLINDYNDQIDKNIQTIKKLENEISKLRPEDYEVFGGEGGLSLGYEKEAQLERFIKSTRNLITLRDEEAVKLENVNLSETEAIETLAFAIKNNLVTKKDLIGVNEEYIQKAIELSKVVKVETSETDEDTDGKKKNIDAGKKLIDIFKNLTLTIKKYNEETTQLDKIKGWISDVDKLGGSISELGEATGDSGIEQLGKTIGNVAEVAGNAGNVLTKMATGDWVGALIGSVNLIIDATAKLINWINKAEMEDAEANERRRERRREEKAELKEWNEIQKDLAIRRIEDIEKAEIEADIRQLQRDRAEQLRILNEESAAGQRLTEIYAQEEQERIDNATGVEKEKLELEKQMREEEAAIKAEYDAQILEKEREAFELQKNIEKARLEIEKAKALAAIPISKYSSVKFNKATGQVETEINPAYTTAYNETTRLYDDLADLISGQTFAKGTSSVPYNMMAGIHAGERIVPSGINIPNISNADLMDAALRGMQLPGAGGGSVVNNSSINNSRSQNFAGANFMVKDVTTREQFEQWAYDFAEDTGRSL